MRQALKDEIQGLRFKSQGYIHATKIEAPPSAVPSEIELFQIPRTHWRPRKKYFPMYGLLYIYFIFIQVTMAME